jgi:hypothetical protein
MNLVVLTDTQLQELELRVVYEQRKRLLEKVLVAGTQVITIRSGFNGGPGRVCYSLGLLPKYGNHQIPFALDPKATYAQWLLANEILEVWNAVRVIEFHWAEALLRGTVVRFLNGEAFIVTGTVKLNWHGQFQEAILSSGATSERRRFRPVRRENTTVIVEAV